MQMLLGDGDWIGDVSVASLVTLCAVLTYIRVGFDNASRLFAAYGLVSAIGFSMWATRLWYALLTGNDIIIAPFSQVGIAMMCGGYAATQVLAIRNLREFKEAELKCFRDPQFPCRREDRLNDRLKEIRMHRRAG